MLLNQFDKKREYGSQMMEKWEAERAKDSQDRSSEAILPRIALQRELKLDHKPHDQRALKI